VHVDCEKAGQEEQANFKDQEVQAKGQEVVMFRINYRVVSDDGSIRSGVYLEAPETAWESKTLGAACVKADELELFLKRAGITGMVEVVQVVDSAELVEARRWNAGLDTADSL
jgi:3-mercaptopyruvate sulfurtransferase SseA